MQSETLQPCPWCNGEGFLFKVEGGAIWPSAYHTETCPARGVQGAYWLTEAEAIAAWNTRASVEISDAMVEALRTIADGEEPRPVGKVYRKDGVESKHDQCVHGIWMYETCGACVSNFARAALGPTT